MTLILTTREELREILQKELPAAIKESNNRPNPEKIYTRAQAARLLGKSYNTIKNMIMGNRLTTTADGKYISQREIDHYLTGQKSSMSQ